jgi:hypothetical protein
MPMAKVQWWSAWRRCPGWVNHPPERRRSRRLAAVARALRSQGLPRDDARLARRWANGGRDARNPDALNKMGIPQMVEHYSSSERPT